MIKLKNILVEQKSKYHIYCDMDGVLTDFDKLFHDISGGEFELGHDYEEKYGREKFWGIVDGHGLKFWSEMPWMPEGKTLWKYMRSVDPNTEILSAPSRSPNSASQRGKAIWIKRELGPTVKLNLTREKYRFAKPNHILIDDLEKNIEPWEYAGGIGILFTSTSQTINELKSLGM